MQKVTATFHVRRGWRARWRGRTGKGTSAAEAGDDRYSRHGTRLLERRETARSNERETAGISVRDEGSERTPERETERETTTARGRRRRKSRAEATRGTTKTGEDGSNEKGEGENCDYRERRRRRREGEGGITGERTRVRSKRGTADTSTATKSKAEKMGSGGVVDRGGTTRRSRRGAFTRERRDG